MTQQERPHQHQRDQAPRARREARRAVDRRAAPEPRQLPARDEALARLGDALRRPRREGPVRRPPRRHRDEPLRELLRGPRAAAHDPRRHRLRLRRGEDDVRPHRRQGLDQQGRDHAGGLRGRRPAEGDAPRRPGHGAPPRRPHARASAASRESGRGRGARTARASARCAAPPGEAPAAAAAAAGESTPREAPREPGDDRGSGRDRAEAAVEQPRGRGEGRRGAEAPRPPKRAERTAKPTSVEPTAEEPTEPGRRPRTRCCSRRKPSTASSSAAAGGHLEGPDRASSSATTG